MSSPVVPEGPFLHIDFKRIVRVANHHPRAEFENVSGLHYVEHWHNMLRSIATAILLTLLAKSYKIFKL
jgi:hypothetical protein